jgi:hypothetical protein
LGAFVVVQLLGEFVSGEESLSHDPSAHFKYVFLVVGNEWLVFVESDQLQPALVTTPGPVTTALWPLADVTDKMTLGHGSRLLPLFKCPSNRSRVSQDGSASVSIQPERG